MSEHFLNSLQRILKKDCKKNKLRYTCDVAWERVRSAR